MVESLDVEDIEFMLKRSARMLIRRSKTDQAGEGGAAYLEPQELTLVGHSPGDYGAPGYRDKRYQ